MNATFYVTTDCIDNRALLWTGLLRFVIFTTDVRSSRRASRWPSACRCALRQERREAFTKLIVTMKNIPTARRLALLEAVRVAGGINDLSPAQSIMMSWDQVREMHRAGMTFGAHTLTHPNLPNAAPEEAEHEIVGSRDALAEQIDEPVRALLVSERARQRAPHRCDQGDGPARRLRLRDHVADRQRAIAGDDVFA